MSVYTLEELGYELSTKIVNGSLLSLLQTSFTTNSTSYAIVGRGQIDMTIFRKVKITNADLWVRSGALGADGMDVQLYDFDNAAEIGIVSFGGAEDNSNKPVDVSAYLKALTSEIAFGVRIKKAGAIGPSTCRSATLQIYGVLV